MPFYHTVYNEEQPHFKYLNYSRSYGRFIDDLDFFCRNFNLLNVQQIGTKKQGFYLSFDDGMSEIYHVIAPILIDKKIPATLFITADFIDNKKMFISHKISLLIHNIKNSDFMRHRVAAFLHCESAEVEKELFSQVEKIDDVAILCAVSFTEYLQENRPYCTTLQLKELLKMGFKLGNHSRTHRNFKQLSFPEQKDEINFTNEILKSIGVDEKYFCFPYGDNQIKNELFKWMFSEGHISKSFGISGLKTDAFQNHHHRILMEYETLSAEQIIKGEYLLFLLKSIFNRNRIYR